MFFFGAKHPRRCSRTEIASAGGTPRPDLCTEDEMTACSAMELVTSRRNLSEKLMRPSLRSFYYVASFILVNNGRLSASGAQCTLFHKLRYRHTLPRHARSRKHICRAVARKKMKTVARLRCRCQYVAVPRQKIFPPHTPSGKFKPFTIDIDYIPKPTWILNNGKCKNLGCFRRFCTIYSNNLQKNIIMG